MADVSSTLAAWSSTTASNNPSGATTIGTGLDDNLREIQGVIVRGLSHKGSDIASVAGTMDIGAVEGLFHDITGALAITGLGTVRAGIWKVLKFEGAATLTHNATSLILPGAGNIVCADGDIGIFISEGSGNWRCLHFLRAASTPFGPTLATEQASTSGTSIDFTGIPSWAKKIIVQFAGVSTSGTSALRIQLGDSGGVEAAGYLGSNYEAGGATALVTDGFGVTAATAAGALWNGAATLTLEDAANFTWACTSALTRSDVAAMALASGTKSTSAALDRVRITTTGGTDTFDAGAINVMYE